MRTMSGDCGAMPYSEMACGSKATRVPDVVTSMKNEWPNHRICMGFLAWADAGRAKAARARPVRRYRMGVFSGGEYQQLGGPSGPPLPRKAGAEGITVPAGGPKSHLNWTSRVRSTHGCLAQVREAARLTGRPEQNNKS